MVEGRSIAVVARSGLGSPRLCELWFIEQNVRSVGDDHAVPRISSFYGIVITMYWRERDHPIPHFHAEQAGHRASIAIDGTILAGELPARALRFVGEWAGLHEDELLANWERARNLEPLEPIDPLP